MIDFCLQTWICIPQQCGNLLWPSLMMKYTWFVIKYATKFYVTSHLKCDINNSDNVQIQLWLHNVIQLLFLHQFLLCQWMIKRILMVKGTILFEKSWRCIVGRVRTSLQPTGTPPCIEEVTFSFLFRQTEAIQVYPVDSAGCNVSPTPALFLFP